MIKDKIRKLLALANNAGATEDEAAVALQKATALMAKHNIETVEESPGQIIMTITMIKPYMTVVAQTAADLNSVYFIRSGTSEGKWIGRTENVEMTAELFKFICDQIERLYKRDLPRGLSVGKRANFRRTYKEAAALTVWRRSVDILDTLRTDDSHALEYTGSTALVVQNTHDQLIDESKDFLADQGITTRAARTRRSRKGSGTFEGLLAGGEVDINRTTQ